LLFRFVVIISIFKKKKTIGKSQIRNHGAGRPQVV
jgi:hypothetical protein